MNLRVTLDFPFILSHYSCYNFKAGKIKELDLNV